MAIWSKVLWTWREGSWRWTESYMQILRDFYWKMDPIKNRCGASTCTLTLKMKTSSNSLNS